MITTASFHQNPKTFTKANKQKRTGFIPRLLILLMLFNIFDNRWIWIYDVAYRNCILKTSHKIMKSEENHLQNFIV